MSKSTHWAFPPEMQPKADEVRFELAPAMRAVVFPEKERSVISQPQPMSAAQRAIVASLAEPPVPKAARVLWYQSKAIELM